jgi:hypothetical protein
MYHIDAKKTWLAIKIQPTNDILHVTQSINFDLKTNINFPKLALAKRWKPI